MKRFAPICSLDMFEKLEKHDAQGDYYLLLAHKILENPGGWKDYFHRQWNGPKECSPFVIMDNSLIECGRPLPLADILKAAKTVDADCFVLPDILGDAQTTIEMSRLAMEEYKANSVIGLGTMGVVQGTSLSECKGCAQALIKMGVNYLAIPRVITKLLGSRIPLAYELGQEYNYAIHFLGFSDNIADDIAAVNVCRTALGIDSSLPLRMGMDGYNLYEWAKYNVRRPGDWLDYERDIIPAALTNLNTMRSWINGGRQCP